jgi:hypothetical protein
MPARVTLEISGKDRMTIGKRAASGLTEQRLASGVPFRT